MNIDDSFDHASRLHLAVLEDLAHQDDGSTSLAMAERLGLTTSTASRIVGEMAHKGWIRFGEHPRDRRCKFLWLTEEGDEARGQLLKPLLRDMTRLGKLMRVERLMHVNNDVGQYRKLLTLYVRSVKMPKRKRPTPLF